MNQNNEKKILVVEDDPNVNRFLRYLLEKHGYEIEVATDGPESLEKVKKLKPRLVLLDIRLPGVSGLEVCRAIKADPELKSTYVIMLTASVSDLDREKGLIAGADEYMTKPFHIKELVERLQELFYSSSRHS
jgi:two-component system alkaline phosphatase synthesis response regulator PhoP